MAPPSRQERLQMRQRGAGARKVNNVEFGFSFGLTPGRVQRSTSKTPRPSHASIRRPSKTPSRSGRESSSRRSVRSASATIDTGENVPSTSTGLLEDKNTHVEKPAVKRRKTQDGNISEFATPADHITSLSASTGGDPRGPSSRNLKSRRRTSGPAFVQIAEDTEDEVVLEQLAQASVVQNDPIQPALEPEVENITTDKENAAPGEHLGKDDSVMAGKPRRKTKKRRSIGQQSGRRKKRRSHESVQSVAEEPLPYDASSRSVNEEPEWETMIDDESGLLLEEVSKPAPPNDGVGKKRRKRKSIVLKPRKRKRSGEFSTQSLDNPAGFLDDKEAHVRVTIEQVISPTPRIQSNRAKRRFSDASNMQTPGKGPTYDPDIEGDETYIDEAASPEKPTPKAPSKKTRSKAWKGRRSGSDVQSSYSGKADTSSSLKKSSKLTFPILTQRMTNISALPIIEEETEHDLDAATDTNSIKTKFTDRSAPNAIDVLAQICRETISTTMSKLSNTSASASTRGLNRKRTAVEAFGSEIDSRLFDMSVAIEHRLTMEARVKNAKQAKREAQNEWMEIRRQREEIALKCDDIRARNQIMEAEGKETCELSEQLHGLEMLVEKPELDGECGTTEGLEYMLRSVAMTVSGATGPGDGLLARVKDYNRQLERTALVLEGRNLD